MAKQRSGASKRRLEAVRKRLDAEDAADRWTQGTCKILTVRLQNGRTRTATVEGYSLGCLFVHNGINEHAATWWVTHKPSGLRLAWMLRLGDAKLMGEAISDRCSMALKRDTKDGILELMPKVITDWMSACMKAKKLLAPPEVVDEP